MCDLWMTAREIRGELSTSAQSALMRFSTFYLMRLVSSLKTVWITIGLVMGEPAAIVAPIASRPLTPCLDPEPYRSAPPPEILSSQTLLLVRNRYFCGLSLVEEAHEVTFNPLNRTSNGQLPSRRSPPLTLPSRD